MMLCISSVAAALTAKISAIWHLSKFLVSQEAAFLERKGAYTHLHSSPYLADQRWYMFANMGPSPSGRSGHALTTFMNKVVVLGGESFTGSKPDDPSIVHVLDTGKIKYPPDNATTKSGSTTGRKSSAPGVVPGSGQQGAAALGAANAANAGAGPSSIAQRSMSPTAERAASPTQGGARQPLNGIVGLMNQQTPPTLAEQQQQQQQQQQQAAQHPGSKIVQVPGAQPPQMQQQMQQQQQQQAPMRAMSPTQGPGQQPRQQPSMQAGLPAAAAGAAGGAMAASAMTPTQSSLQQRAMSPTAVGGPGSTYAGPRSQRSLENMRGANNITSPTAKTTAFPGVMNGYSNAAPADGFYQQSMMNGAATSPVAPSAELEATRKREAWLKAALAMAVKKGFVPPEQIAGADAENVRAPDDIDLNGMDTGLEGTDKDRIVRALITLKTKLAAAQVSNLVSVLNLQL